MHVHFLHCEIFGVKHWNIAQRCNTFYYVFICECVCVCVCARVRVCYYIYILNGNICAVFMLHMLSRLLVWKNEGRC